jgi:FSR family fosmidomycin resistance protein-like MFS transporter
MESAPTQKAATNPKSTDLDFQTGKILALSIGHFIHDVYSSFLAPLLPLLIEKLSMYRRR